MFQSHFHVTVATENELIPFKVNENLLDNSRLLPYTDIEMDNWIL